jgi:tetratricopeptide (TPR) repeat protein
MVGWFGVVLGAVYLIYIGGAWWGIYSPHLRVATMLLAAFALALWAVIAWRNRAWRPKTAMWPAIIACLGSMAVSTAFSRAPRVSAEYLGYAIVLAALYLMLVRLFASVFFRERLATLATLLFALTAIAFLVRVGGYWAHWWDLLGRIALPPLRPGYEGLTYNNPSAALTMVALLAAPAAATLGTASKRGIASIAIILSTVAIVAVVSGSRAGWLALALTVLLGAGAWSMRADSRPVLAKQLGSLLRQRSGRVAMAVVSVAVLGALVLVAPAILPRLIAGGEPQRIGYALAAVRIFEQSPVIGTGPGTWVIQRPAVTTAAEADYYIPHAHNLELQTLAELGVVGALAGVVLVLNILWVLRSGIRDEDAGRRRWAWAGGLVLLYFFLHQLLDFYANLPAFLFAAVIPLAYLDATGPPAAVVGRPALSRRLERAAAAGGAVVVAISIAGLLLQELPALRQWQAVDAANARDWAAADAPAREAAAMDPNIGSYLFTAGLTAARVGDHAPAVAYFEQAARMSDLPEAWLNLAAEQAQLGHVADAAASLERALRIGYQRPIVSMPAGDLALRIGHLQVADLAFSNALLRAPSLAADPWWQSSPDRREALHRAVESAAARAAGSVAWELQLMAGDPARARELATRDSAPTFALTVIEAWTGDDTAADALVTECLANPLRQRELLWCARIEGHRGDLGAANRMLALANVSFQSSYVGGAEVRVSDTGMIGRQLIGEPADLWATYTYRRPGPWDILVPSLIHLRLG